MRKGLIWVPVLLVVLAGCAGSPSTVAPKVTAPQFVIVDHKNAAWGVEPPEWVLKDQVALENDRDFEGQYVFRFEQTGKNLNGVKLWATNFVAQSEIAKLVNTRVQDKFVGAAAGDVDMLETYMEEVVKVLAEAQYTGYRKYDDYWVLKSYIDQNGREDRQEYLYVIVYTISQDVLDELVERSLESAGEAVKPKTEEEQTARDRVKAAFDGGF